VTDTRLILVRHGESYANAEKYIGGLRSCRGLTDAGRWQAERLRDRLLREGDIVPDVLVSSSYPRALETARIIAPALGSLPVTVEPGWGEHDPGPECDGLPFTEFVERYGMPDWDGDPYDVLYPGGETKAEFADRITSTLKHTMADHSGCTVVVACHGGTVDVMMRIALHAPLNGKFEIHTGNTAITEMVHVKGSKWRLVRYNDTAHLAEF